VRKMRHALVGFVGFVGLSLLAAASPAWAGMHYTAVSTTDDQQGHSMKMQVEGWVSGDKAKVVFSQSDNPIMKPGSYLLAKDGGHTLYLVNPEDKTYAVWDLNAMLGVVGGVMNGMGPILKFEFSDPKVEKISEEDGGAIAGVPTRHYKFRTSYSMKMRVFGIGRSSDSVVEQDVWASKRLADPGFGVWLRADPPRTGNAEFDKLMAAETEKSRIEGFPLKMVSVSTTTQKGRQQVGRHTLEVTKLETRSLPSSTFELPAGYQETQVLPTAEHRRGER
jgi:hypothetical protein